jgi:hypothetical protein
MIESLRGETWVSAPAVWLVTDADGELLSAHGCESDARLWVILSEIHAADPLL